MNKESEVMLMSVNNELLDALDEEIEESIQKFQNAKTGAEVRAFVSTYEELMLRKSQELTRIAIRGTEAKREEAVTDDNTDFADNQFCNVTAIVTDSVLKHRTLLLSIFALAISIAALIFNIVSRL